MVQKVNQCCCFTLPMGAQILGWLGIVGGVFDIFGAIGVLVSGESTNKVQIHSTAHDFHDLQALVNGQSAGQPTHDVAKFLMSLVSSLVTIIVSALLIVGTRRKSHTMILPYLIIHGIGLVCLCLAVLALTGFGIFLLCFGGQTSQPGGVLLGIAVIVALFAALSYYLFIAMYSHYTNIRDESRRPQRPDAEKLNPSPYPQPYPANPNSYQITPMYNNQS